MLYKNPVWAREKSCSESTCPPLPEMLAFDLPAVCGDLPAIAMCAGIVATRRPWRWQAGGRRVPAHKLNIVSGVGRRVHFQAKRFLPGPDRVFLLEIFLRLCRARAGPLVEMTEKAIGAELLQKTKKGGSCEGNRMN